MKEEKIKQVCFRLPEALLLKFKEKLKRESKSVTLFIQNRIKRYVTRDD